jgi:hypothetical protein
MVEQATTSIDLQEENGMFPALLAYRSRSGKLDKTGRRGADP